MSLKKKEAFYTELAVLLRAGLDLKTALELITEGLAGKKEKDLFQSIAQGIIAGSSLSSVLERSGKFSTGGYLGQHEK